MSFNLNFLKKEKIVEKELSLEKITEKIEKLSKEIETLPKGKKKEDLERKKMDLEKLEWNFRYGEEKINVNPKDSVNTEKAEKNKEEDFIKEITEEKESEAKQPPSLINKETIILKKIQDAQTEIKRKEKEQQDTAKKIIKFIKDKEEKKEETPKIKGLLGEHKRIPWEDLQNGEGLSQSQIDELLAKDKGEKEIKKKKEDEQERKDRENQIIEERKKEELKEEKEQNNLELQHELNELDEITDYETRHAEETYRDNKDKEGLEKRIQEILNSYEEKKNLILEKYGKKPKTQTTIEEIKTEEKGKFTNELNIIENLNDIDSSIKEAENTKPEENTIPEEHTKYIPQEKTLKVEKKETKDSDTIENLEREEKIKELVSLRIKEIAKKLEKEILKKTKNLDEIPTSNPFFFAEADKDFDLKNIYQLKVKNREVTKRCLNIKEEDAGYESFFNKTKEELNELKKQKEILEKFLEYYTNTIIPTLLTKKIEKTEEYYLEKPLRIESLKEILKENTTSRYRENSGRFLSTFKPKNEEEKKLPSTYYLEKDLEHFDKIIEKNSKPLSKKEKEILYKELENLLEKTKKNNQTEEKEERIENKEKYNGEPIQFLKVDNNGYYSIITPSKEPTLFYESDYNPETKESKLNFVGLQTKNNNELSTVKSSARRQSLSCMYDLIGSDEYPIQKTPVTIKWNEKEIEAQIIERGKMLLSEITKKDLIKELKEKYSEILNKLTNQIKTEQEITSPVLKGDVPDETKQMIPEEHTKYIPQEKTPKVEKKEVESSEMIEALKKENEKLEKILSELLKTAEELKKQIEELPDEKEEGKEKERIESGPLGYIKDIYENNEEPIKPSTRERTIFYENNFNKGDKTSELKISNEIITEKGKKMAGMIEKFFNVEGEKGYVHEIKPAVIKWNEGERLEGFLHEKGKVILKEEKPKTDWDNIKKTILKKEEEEENREFIKSKETILMNDYYSYFFDENGHKNLIINDFLLNQIPSEEFERGYRKYFEIFDDKSKNQKTKYKMIRPAIIKNEGELKDGPNKILIKKGIIKRI